MTILSLDNSIRKAEKLLKNKNFEEAKIEFSEILKKFPHNLRAKNGIKKISSFILKENSLSFKNYFSTLLNLYSKNKFQEVIFQSEAILENVEERHLIFNLMAASYAGLKKFEKAFENYFKAIEIKPDFFEGYNNIGHLCNETGNYEKAIAFFKRSISIKENDYQTHNNIANTYLKLHQLEKATFHYNRSLQINPDFAEAYNNLGNIEKETGNYKNAIKLFLKSISKNQNLVDPYNNLGVVYNFLKENELAKKYLMKAIELFPEFADSYGNLGNIFSKEGDFEKAINYYKKALSINPLFFHAYNNMGNALKDLGKLEESISCYNKAIELNPKFPNAYDNLGNALRLNGKIQEAINSFNKAIEIDKNYPEAYFNLSILELNNGLFKNGWKNFKWRWFANNFDTPKLNLGLQTYNLKNTFKNVFISYEQGIGDQILYARFFNDLPQNKLDIYGHFNSKLINLMSSSFKQVIFLDKIKKEEIDSHIPLGDLPGLFINDFSDLKERSGPYLKVDKKRRDELKKLLPKNKKICGLSWLSKNEELGLHKSISLEQLKDILLIKDIVFVDLQYSDTNQERKEFLKKYGVEIIKLDQVDNFDDLTGLTALIDACDFVLSVSNTTVHLSGAIGKKTYLMLPKGKGKLWYWSKDGQQSHWYKSVKIFEQDKIGHWEPVIKTIYNEIKK